MDKYKLFIRKFSIFANDYVVVTKIVETNDIYHEIRDMRIGRKDIVKINEFE